ncbi:MAG: choice-of-anchor P family protein [Terracidiphilus sp.]|jgi:hypothetical protein
MKKNVARKHRYHASATAISGHLKLPLETEITPQAHCELPAKGGHCSQRIGNFSVQEVISFRSAYTRVSGNKGTKDGHGWTTMTTTVIEGLNVLEVVTADRVVMQTITEHPLEGYVPSVSFLGTHFENLRVAGQSVELELDHNLLGEKPDGDGAYTKERGVITRVRSQYSRILASKGLPKDLRERYKLFSSNLGKTEEIECSLVNRASGSHPGHSFGHIIHVPDFGKIVLARLKVSHDQHDTPTGAPRLTNVQLTMVDLELGCVTDGMVAMASGSDNGAGDP